MLETLLVHRTFVNAVRGGAALEADVVMLLGPATTAAAATSATTSTSTARALIELATSGIF